MLILSLIQKLHRNPRTRKVLWKYMYQFLMGSYRATDWTFSNYGYSPIRRDEETPRLQPSEEVDRYCIQLYHHVANPSDLKGLRVLEVGSGRGGGSAYYKRYFHPRVLIGVDLSQKAVAFSAGCHRLEGLSFVPADAECLPFRNNTFDVVVNVESSHCYPSMEAFVDEVARVLRPGGYFLFADFRPKGRLATLRDELQRPGLALLKESDITPNVLAALADDSARKLQVIRRRTPKLMWKFLGEIFGLEGSQMYTAFRSGGMRYLSFVLQKHMKATAA